MTPRPVSDYTVPRTAEEAALVARATFQVMQQHRQGL